MSGDFLVEVICCQDVTFTCNYGSPNAASHHRVACCVCVWRDRDTIDAVKQSAALCLLRLIRSNPDAMPMSEWASRVIHLLNDQHMVGITTSHTAYI